MGASLPAAGGERSAGDVREVPVCVIVTIRDYTEADWPAVCRVHDVARVVELAGGDVDTRAYRCMAAVVENDGFFDATSLVACLEGCVVGFVSWNGACITWLYVDPARHRRGIGRRLLRAALAAIGPEAWTIALARNAAARALYEAAGMQVVFSEASDCEGYPCTNMRLALPTSRMRNPAAQWSPRDGQA